MKKYIALNSVSFSGKISGVRYAVDVGKSYEPNVAGDFDGVMGIVFEAEPEQEPEIKAEPLSTIAPTTEPKPVTVKKSAPKKTNF